MSYPSFPIYSFCVVLLPLVTFLEDVKDRTIEVSHLIWVFVEMETILDVVRDNLTFRVIAGATLMTVVS